MSKNAAVHWSEDAMKKALSSYQTGGMSINQAAIHYNLPYSSLYGRINRYAGSFRRCPTKKLHFDILLSGGKERMVVSP